MKTKKTVAFLHDGPAWVQVKTRQPHRSYKTVRAHHYGKLTPASYRRLLRLAYANKGAYKVKWAGMLGCYITREREA